MKTKLLIIALLYSAFSFGQVPTSGLIGQYEFTFGSLADTYGSSHLTQTGSSRTGTANRAGGANRAISLNGDHLQRSTFGASDALSMSFWIKTSTNNATKRTIIDNSNRTTDAESQSQYGIYAFLQNGKIGLAGNFHYRYQVGSTVYEGEQGYASVLGSTVVADDNWHHVVIELTKRIYYWQNSNWVFESMYYVYIDGALAGSYEHYKHSHAGSSVLSSIVFPPGAVTIANNAGATLSNRFTESIDDIRFYNRALNTTEIGQLYNETVCGGSTSVTAITRNIEVQLDASGNATITAAAINNGSVDFCGSPATVSVDITSFTCDDLGENTVTLTAEDGDGNSDMATATVTVVPAVVRKNISVQLDAAGNVTILPSDVAHETMVVCPGVTLSLDVSDFTCANLGPNTVTLTADDGNGNSSSGTAVVTVYDTLAPIVVAQNISVQLNQQTGMATITTGMIDNGSTDNCSAGLTLSLSQTTFTCTDVGENAVTLTAEDANGNSAEATIIVTVTSFVNDETVTAIDTDFCPDGSAGATISTGSSVVGVNYYLRNSADNAIVDGPIAGTGSPLDFNTGNLSQTTTFNILASVEAEEEIVGSALEFDGVNDKVEIPFAGALVGTSAFTIEAWINPTKTSYSRIVTRFSGTGNTAGDVVFDTGSPQDNGRGLRLYMVRANATATNISVDNVLTLNTWNHVAATFNAGTMTIYVNGVQVVTGAFGQSTLVAPSTSWVLGEDRGGTVAEFFAGKMDEVRFWNVARSAVEIQDNMSACAVANQSGLTAHYKFDEDAGTTLSDNTGHANTGNLLNMDANTDWVAGVSITCQQNCEVQLSTEITIGDTTPPTATAQSITLQLDETGTATLLASAINNGSSDNCTAAEGLVLSVDKTMFTCDDIGENTITLTVTDAAGNESTTTATVTIEDEVPPTALAKVFTLQVDASGNATLSAADINNNSADNCTAQQDLVLSIDKTTFTCTDLGENTITLTVTDASGNEATTTAIVTVVDEVLPTALTQNVTLQLDASGNATLVASAIDNGSSDNCTTVTLSLDKTTFSCSDLGENTVTLTVTDASNNQATATVTVTIEDAIAPTVLTQNITVYLGMDGVADISPAEINNGSSDNCSATENLSMSLDKSSFTLADVGDNTVTLTVEDAQGNSEMATATVTVEDRLEQSITFAALAERTFGDAAFELSAAASSELTVSYSSSNDNVATINGTTVTIIGAGSTTITALQAGDDDFKAAPGVEQTLVVNKADQAITFTLPTSVNFTSGNLTLTATSSTGLPVSFASADETIATISGTTVTFVTPGLVEIAANQDGNANYNAAPSIVASITITDDRQTIALSGSLAFGNVLQNETDQKTLTISNTGNATLEITSITLPAGFTSSVSTASVNANATLSVTITFTPTELKAYSGSVVVASNAVSGANELAVSGTGVTITGFNEPNQPAGQLDVYPNPGTGVFVVKGKISKGRQVVITTLSGQMLQRTVQFQDENTHVLDITDLPSGVYYLKVEEKGSVAVKRIVKLN